MQGYTETQSVTFKNYYTYAKSDIKSSLSKILWHNREHNYHIIGPLRVYLIITLHHTFNANNWLSEIQIPIE